jgi:hypothetical protein
MEKQFIRLLLSAGLLALVLLSFQLGTVIEKNRKADSRDAITILLRPEAGNEVTITDSLGHVWRARINQDRLLVRVQCDEWRATPNATP